MTQHMEFKTEVKYAGTGLQFTGHGPEGTTIHIDGNTGTGPSPLVLLLQSLAACAAIDIIHILQKMRLPLESLTVEVDAEREEGKDTARKWTAVRLRFKMKGDIPPARAQKAIDLSVAKYCSVYRQLEDSAAITTELIQS